MRICRSFIHVYVIFCPFILLREVMICTSELHVVAMLCEICNFAGTFFSPDAVGQNILLPEPRGLCPENALGQCRENRLFFQGSID